MLAPLAAAQREATLPPGPLHLEEPLVVAAGDTLTIGPATLVTGSARIEVWGALRILGNRTAPAELSVPVVLRGNGTSHVEEARLWGVNGTALEVAGGQLVVRNVTFEASTRGIQAGGEAFVDAQDVVMRGHSGEAVYVHEGAALRLRRANVTENGRGATVFSTSGLRIEDSRFSENGQHVVVDVGPWSRQEGELAFVRNDFGPVLPAPVQLPSLLLRHEPPVSPDAGGWRLVLLEDNRVHDGAVGLRAEGRGLLVESRGDRLDGNRVGLSVQLATVDFDRATFGNDVDVEGMGDVRYGSVTYLRASGAAETPDAPNLWPFLALGCAGLVGAGALLFVPALRRLGRRPAGAAAPRGTASPAARSAPDAAPEPEPAPETGDAPAQSASPTLTAQERRILDDIAAHPGTPQRAVADRLGLTRQALHYHVKKLEARGLVRKTAQGRETHCEVPAEVLALLAAAPAAPAGDANTV